MRLQPRNPEASTASRLRTRVGLEVHCTNTERYSGSGGGYGDGKRWPVAPLLSRARILGDETQVPQSRIMTRPFTVVQMRRTNRLRVPFKEKERHILLPAPDLYVGLWTGRPDLP